MKKQRQLLTGWGRYGGTHATTFLPDNLDQLEHQDLPGQAVVARGLGRSYGDAAQLADGNAVITTKCDSVDWIDRERGLIRCDAGATVGQLIDRFAPKGWFVPVTPGTRSVTIGGAIAADIHGKNHHVDGSFVSHVPSMRIRLASDEILAVSPTEHGELFWATAGGMGLTGVILDAVIQLTPVPTTTVAVETQRFESLGPLVDEMRKSDQEHDFSVAWVDLLHGARSVLTQGAFATARQLVELGVVADAAGNHRRPGTFNIGLPRVPLPRVAVTPGVRAFNELWFRKAPAEPTLTGESITAFFHPLDAIRDWNRVYGRTGFVQWQCVVPDDQLATLNDLVDRLGDLPSFFTVLKRFGPGNPGPLSFPTTGWTLAVDLPATTKTLTGLPALDQMVADAGGRIYLAKDARVSRSHFETMYPRLDDFKKIRSQVDPTSRFSSDLAARLGL